MQNGSLDGTSQEHTHDDAGPEHKLPGSAVSDGQAQTPVPQLITPESKDDIVPIAHPEAPPLKKRKLADSSGRTTPRPPSPPWKSASADGPTSFIENGRRKSSRTNAVPLELVPQSDKRHTRAARQEYVNNSKSHASWQSSPSGVTHSQSDVNGRRFSSSKTGTNGFGPSPRKDAGKGAHTRTASSQTPGSKGQLSRNRTPSVSTPNTLNKSASHAGRTGQKWHHDEFATPGSSPVSTRTMRTSERNQLSQTAERNATGSSPKLPRLRFKVKMPSLGVNNPSHVLPPRKYSTFREWVENETATEDSSNILTDEAALREAEIRERVRKAGEPGQPLSQDRSSYYMPEPAEEPPQQYAHQDHFVAHALFFKKLLDKERKHHRNLAKLLAQSCADAWRKRNKRPEDILREQQEEMRQKHKQLFRDLQRQFDLVRAEVDKRRLERWEEERKAEDQLALNKAIKQSTMLFEKRRPDRVGDATVTDTGDDQSEEETDSEEEQSGESEDETEGESNMSSSESEADDDGLDDDATLTAEELRLKYAHLASTKVRSEGSEDAESRHSSVSSSRGRSVDGGLDPSMSVDTPDHTPQLDEVDPMLLDESDESTDMDDDMGDSDEGDESSEGESDGSIDEELGMLGFFSAKELADAKDTASGETTGEPSEIHDGVVDNGDEMVLVPGENDKPEDNVRNDEEHAALVDTADGPNGISKSRETTSEPAAEPLPAEFSDAESTSIKPEQAEGSPTEPLSEELPDAEAVPPENAAVQPPPVPSPTKSVGEPEIPVPKETSSAPSPAIKTPIPHLLRGTLREYQHFGLDWLAGLYTSNINGILADEMGLGKTIQTIALLAHLAVEHEVWGPHLVVVPTSVMLNWEMEFKKWCPGFKILTYYGTQEERRQKRKGWMDDDRWHVCITSYQLVLQDQQTFKRRNWHYMVLDEAHNIKNFRSQRWQTLLTFKTQARLLLTGTPLQNNLTELWSLLFFLMPTDGSDTGVEGFADLRNFSEWFRRPVEQILEHGRETMDDEAKQVVSKLHTVLRPYILRRLKADVEKQMPAKYEHVVLCRLSKRQRYLYDGFMSRAQTKETLASGNYLSIINCLMQLRKVCNHPDLFETRPITTSFAMPKSAIVDFEIKELVARRRLLNEDSLSSLNLDFLNLVPISREETSRRLADDATRIMAYGPLRLLRERQYNRTNWDLDFDGSSVQTTLVSMENNARKRRMGELERCLYFESKRHGRRPIYGASLRELVTIDTGIQSMWQRPPQRSSMIDWLSRQSPILSSIVQSVNDRSMMMDSFVQKFACVTPAAIAPGITEAALTPIVSRRLTTAERLPPYDPFHEAQTRLSIAFPDKRLLQYDCGKLQQLDKLLRKLQSGGHRALIFTQMTKMLDILEQFLNIHGHRYLRLDGATRVEQRQMLTERFNNDTRILAFILSSRSGGLGINLTGADTVIFYDLDWNPAMDKQCQDRCHRIGQTRDVHIYRFVSEYTIESNILRKANQKRMLDDVVIQEGEFTTDYFQKLDVRDMLDEENLQDGHDEASAAMDRVLDTRVGGQPRTFEQAEDKEDIDAAKNAEKELEHVDDADFEEGSAPQTPGQPGTSQVGTPAAGDAGEYEASVNQTDQRRTAAQPESAVNVLESEPNHIDDYLIRFMEWNLRGEPLVLPPDKNKKKSKRGKEHRVKRHR